MTLEPYKKQSNYSFTLGENKRFELKKLKDAISLIELMSRDNQNIIMVLEIENFKPLSFYLKTKFVKES